MKHLYNRLLSVVPCLGARTDASLVRYRQLALIACLLFSSFAALAQKGQDVYVDNKGVMRWSHNKKEVQGFGVNYTVPFAHAYRSAKKLGVKPEEAIDQDIYHFARLGFDAFRVHVWDTEISDSVGNLLPNDHLRLLDYTLFKLKERGIKSLLTPIAYWGNGWPEPDDKTPGFANKWGKEGSLVEEEAIKAQEEYLYQFLNHVNQYTGIAYKDDPDIVAFEISNEPHHRGTPEEVTRFINRMAASMRKTGSKKPIFYNVTHSIHLDQAYFNANIQGGTFQWYPTGLGSRHELRGNFLPNVDKYPIPFAENPNFKKAAKVVYEFDAADIGRSYIYPAMARSFREAGIQWATHFSYDPTFMAYANTEYNTHYMNLVYAPQKALSLKIASEVFHRIPLYKSYGAYPANTSFDAFRVSYEEDLAEMITDTKYLYTNTTSTKAPKPQALEEISGFGNSPLVQYEGKGAYFLDKISPGVWRLEVLPDALWVGNLFATNSLDKEVAVVNWRSWPMQVQLPDLGQQFKISVLNSKQSAPQAKGTAFDVSPGVYLLVREGVTSKVKAGDKWKNIRLNEFAAPATTLKNQYVMHKAFEEVAAGKPVTISATVITATQPEQVDLHLSGPAGNKTIAMDRAQGYEYRARIPADVLEPGYLNYTISITDEGKTRSFPADKEGSPRQWDFYDATSYRTAIVPQGKSLYLFQAYSDADEVSKEWRKGTNLHPGEQPYTASLQLSLAQLFVPDPENQKGAQIHDYALRYNFRDKIAGRAQEVPSFKKLVLRGKSMDKSFPVQLALIDSAGNVYGGRLTLDPQKQEYVLALADLKPVKQVLLPRPYPSFLPYFFEPSATKPLDLSSVETLQISVGGGKPEAEAAYAFEIESVRLEK